MMGLIINREYMFMCDFGNAFSSECDNFIDYSETHLCIDARAAWKVARKKGWKRIWGEWFCPEHAQTGNGYVIKVAEKEGG